ncbi:hypothetical protein ACEWY4_005056 [Coilia grayii]|uniref:C1q domain-containing protein n=1 Tax=Coilia grayii TaxID=363190 RepID=A0ABD1KH83_9TELE
MVVELRVRLTVTENEVENLKKENAAQEAELTAVNTRGKMRKKSKVAFSAGLTDLGYVKAGSDDLNLLFSRIITNVGQAYNSTTGFFTAPVRGVYYFRFTVRDHLASHWMNIRMFKNGQGIMWLDDYETDDYNTYLSSGLTVELEVGDVVNMVLPAGCRIIDNSNNFSTFSGFLLFPL